MPPGWKIIDSAFGDLNNDYQDDYAIILQYSDSVTILKTNENVEDTVVTQPRILLSSMIEPSRGIFLKFIIPIAVR